MTVAATSKCNITGLTKELVDQINWGIPPSNTLYNAMLENYITYTECDVGLVPCYVDDCDNDPVILTCSLGIQGIAILEFPIGTNQIKFIVTFTNSPGTDASKNTYQWTYDTNVFTPSGATDQSTLLLTLKPGKDMDAIVTPISVTITDENRCVVTKQCYYVREAMDCTDGYQPCSNPSDLKVTNLVVLCGGIHDLTVKKKP